RPPPPSTSTLSLHDALPILLHELLLHEKIATPQDIHEASRASDEDLLRVHTQQWVTKLKTGTLTASDVMKLEVPYSPELAEAVRSEEHTSELQSLAYLVCRL